MARDTKIVFLNQLVVSAPGLERELHNIAVAQGANAAALEHVAIALGRIAAAQERIATAAEPEPQRKATTVTFGLATSEPLENAMANQFHVGVEGFGMPLRFNGLIDGEPVLSMSGPGTMTQDPKIEQPSQDNPNQKETIVNTHFRNNGPDVGEVTLTVHAVADDPVTPEEEDIDASAVVGEWIAQTQAKATTVSFGNAVSEAP